MKSIDIVLQLNGRELDESCGYYLVDHDNKTIFWLQDMALVCVTQGIKEAIKLEHIDTEILTSSSKALSPFNAEELATLSDIVDKIIIFAEKNQETAQPKLPYTYPPHHMWALARIMGFFTQAKFYNFCGQPWARLNADQRIYYKKKSNFAVTALSFAFDILSFGAVHIHMAQIREIWVERSISSLRWKDFNTKLSNEWSNITIYSTVMLAVDVSFLAVPSIPLSPSVVVLTTQISVICIMGSIVVSVFLSLQNRRYGCESVDVAAAFLLKMTGSIFGTKALSFVYSLPLVLLAWGMLCFGLAFSYFMFISHFKVALVTAGCGGFIVIMLISWPVWHQVYWLFAGLFTRRMQVCHESSELPGVAQEYQGFQQVAAGGAGIP
ncbi:hypothetical protein EDB19DRAFT_1914518 [Suillus lakei]|nr:hypothetical protein EDB19DRAFT_1914518 [Suillus lakei]